MTTTAARFGTVLKYAVGAYLFQEYVAECNLCRGPSMYPTFNPEGDVILSEHLSARVFRSLRAGDVIVAESPIDTSVYICKRIRGMPGDTIRTRDINSNHVRHATVPPGHVWLEGDNPNNSTDSRTYGAVPMDLVRGRVILKVWPLWESGLVRRQIIDHTRAPQRS